MVKEGRAHSLLRLGKCSYSLEHEYLQDLNGQQITLRPQTAQVFKHLVDCVGEVVSKEQLINAVWQGLSVTDDSIVQCISEIRRAIQDVDRTVLRTVPKKGYRLVAFSEESDQSPTPVEPRVDLDVSGDIRDEITSVYISLSQVDRQGPHTRNVDAGLKAEFKSFLECTVRSMSSGRIAREDADSFVLEFNAASAAVDCALIIGNWHSETQSTSSDSVQLMICCGVALGKAYGNGGSLAKALADLGEGNATVLSDRVSGCVSGQLDYDLTDIGDHFFSEFGKKIRCFKVGLKADQAQLLPLLNPEDLLPTIAVIPFESRSADHTSTALGEIFVDDIVSLLSRSNDLNIISRLSTTRFRNRGATLDEIGSVLQADFVVSGRCSERAGYILVDVELAEVKSGRILWADQTEHRQTGAFETTEISEWVVSSVKRAILNREVFRARSNPVTSLASYTLLMSAVSFMHRLSPSDFEKARELLEHLIQRMPNHPVPLAWMARWHVLRVQQGWSQLPGREAAAALNCTNKALDLDPENVLALVSEGFVLTNLLRQLDEAEMRYDGALNISPNDAVGRLLRGTLFAFQGEGARAMRDTERSLHLTPLDPHRFFFLSLSASACIAAGDYERALKLSNMSLQGNSTHTSTLRVKAVAQMRLNQVENAKNTGRKLMKLQPNLRIRDWLKSSPSNEYAIGREFAETLKDIGIPN